MRFRYVMALLVNASMGLTPAIASDKARSVGPCELQPYSSQTASGDLVQLELSVPFAPTVFPSAGTQQLMYELHLTNFSEKVVELTRVEIIDASAEGTQPITVFDGEKLRTLLRAREHPSSGTNDTGLQLRDGERTVAFLTLAFSRTQTVPARLCHRVHTTDGRAYTVGAAIDTAAGPLPVYGPPLEGFGWRAGNGPGQDTHHRRALIALAGHARASARYAIDWIKMEKGASFAGDRARNVSYHAYGADVIAVADGVITTVRDGIAENVPGDGSRAVPITIESAPGNVVVLDLGNGQFAVYMHLIPGSIAVKPGDRVTRGQPLGRLGNSGNSEEPHLHFEITNGPMIYAAEGVPYLIDAYDTAEGRRANELPLNDMSISFAR